MTTQQNNIKISKFMGRDPGELEPGQDIFLTYDTDWNELIPVVQEIGRVCREHKTKATNKDEWAIDGWKTWSEQICRFNGNLADVTKEATFKKVIQFIDWYNNQKVNP